MEAIVMAAGEGSRLRPLSDVWPKPVLPIDGRPVVGTLLRELAAAGVTRATVVTGHLADQVERLLRDGSGAAAMTVRREPPPSAARPPVRIRDGLVERVIDDDPANPLGSAPLWALGPELERFLRAVEGPPFELAAAVQAAVDAGL